jgi:hypothetical protein
MAGADHGSLARRLVFWDFPRASWQYDVVVAVILLFIFATPREWFRDQPKASGVVLMSSVHGTNQVFIASELLSGIDETQRANRAEALIRERTGKKWHVVRVEPIKDEAEKEIKGFIAYTAR